MDYLLHSDTYFHMIATWCDSLMFISKALPVGRRLLSAGGIADFCIIILHSAHIPVLFIEGARSLKKS